MTEHEWSGSPALHEFNQRMSRCGHAVVCVDYDGTLAPFVNDTRDARPYAGVAEALDALMATGRARVIVVTGRFLRAAPPVLGTRVQPELWGSHGRERLLPDGDYRVAGIDEYALRALTIVDGWIPEIEAAGGRCEAKPGALAVHWRGVGSSQVVAVRSLLLDHFEREALEGSLELRNFDGGIELRAPGLDKGDVIRAVLDETPPGMPVSYLGDDYTDEDAFNALRGNGLGVLVRPVRRDTAADIWIRPPGELLELLGLWRETLAQAP
jgi:trehalose-phosphatase